MMKKILLALGLSLALEPANAQTIDALGAGSALGGTEKIPMFQTANPAVTTTPTAVKTFILGATNTWSGTQTFGPVVGSINSQTGTTYTLAATDCGKTVLLTNASSITLTTLNSLPAGCSISVEQGGAGQITVANGSGATLTSAHGYSHTFNTAGAIIGLFVDTNFGSNAHFVLTGDGT